MKYICPKCRVVIESGKPLSFCVCGGKMQQLGKPVGDQKTEALIDAFFDGLLKDIMK